MLNICLYIVLVFVAGACCGAFGSPLLIAGIVCLFRISWGVLDVDAICWAWGADCVCGRFWDLVVLCVLIFGFSITGWLHCETCKHWGIDLHAIIIRTLFLILELYSLEPQLQW